MVAPKKFSAKLTQRTCLTPKVIKLDFEVTDSPSFNFTPGQFVSIMVSDTQYRSYSIASASNNGNMLSIIASVDHQGVGVNYLKALNIGDSVTMVGPAGRFMLSPHLPDNLLFIATGTGIAPLISMLNSLASTHHSGKIRLYFGVRTESEILYAEELNRFKSTLPNFDFTICVSQPTTPLTGENYFTGRVTDLLRVQFPTLSRSIQFYLCGHPQMIEDVVKFLSKNQVHGNQIFHEKFTRSVA